MKIGVVNRANREGNTGFTAFEDGALPYLLEDERFEPIDYTFHGGVRAITSEILLGRKVRKADERNDYDVIFVPTHTQMMNIDQERIDAQVVPYIHDMLVLSSPYYNFIYNLKGRKWLPNVKKCDFIFSASDFTAKDLKIRGGFKGEIETDLPEDEWQDLYRNAYTVLFLAEKEDWGIIPVEAGSYGKPVIAVKEGDPTESVVNDWTGYLVPPKKEVIADKIKELASSPEKANVMGHKGLENVKKYSWSNFSEKLDDTI